MRLYRYNDNSQLPLNILGSLMVVLPGVAVGVLGFMTLSMRGPGVGEDDRIST